MRLSRPDLEAIIRHALAEAPNEACGILAGKGDRVERVYCLENADHSPTTYSLTPDGLMLAAELESAGRLLAVFHSHVAGPAYPSPTDRKQAWWDVRYVVISLTEKGQPDIRVFRIRKDIAEPDDLGEVVEEGLEIEDDPANA